MIIIVGVTQRKRFIADCKMLWADKKKGALLVGASLLISCNWLIYIWAVSNNHVMDTSIGYYINPLLSVLLGVVVFKEYLIPAKWFAIAIAALGILMLTILHGVFPWISIGLALTFAIYGALKKKLNINPFSSITLETFFVTPLALIYLFFIDDFTLAYFNHGMTSTAWLLVFAGVTTSVPLVLFSFGANLLPLNVLGFLQYIAPTIAFVLSIFYFHEVFGLAQMLAFTCIWIALAIFSMSEKLPNVPLKKIK